MRRMSVKQEFLDLIKQGSKTLEVRVAYENVNRIQPGERIVLASRTEEQVVRVREIRRYTTFADLLASEDPARIVPGTAPNEVRQLLEGIYPPDKQQLGIVVLDIEAERCLWSHSAGMRLRSVER